MNIKYLYQIITTGIVLLALGTACQRNKPAEVNDLEQEGLLGRVKQIETYYYEVEELPTDTLEDRHNVYSRLSYNEAGYKTEERIEDCFVEHYRYRYDQSGKKLVESLYEVLGDETEVGKTNYNYGKNGLVAEETYFEGKERKYHLHFEYDKENLLSATKYYDAEDSLYHTIYNQYNDKGLLSRSYLQNPEGETWNPTTYRYNEKGFVIEERHYSSDSVQEYSKFYDYNDKGQKISEKHDTGKPETSHQEYYSYDQYGNLAKRVRTDLEGETSYRYAYEYDEQGNWTKCLCYLREHGGEGTERLITLNRRRIQYYPTKNK